MKSECKLRKVKAVSCALLYALLFVFGTASAAVVDITAEFKADIRNPGNNRFKNVTPVSGFCAEHPGRCGQEYFTILIPALTARKTFRYESKNLKDHTWQSIDGRNRSVQLTNSKTGKQTTAQFRWALSSLRYSADASQKLGFSMRNASTPEGDCSVALSYAHAHTYRLGWRLHPTKGTCYRKLHTQEANGDVKLDEISMGYSLTIDRPLELPPGEYRGELVYTVGDGMDVDFGADSYSDTEVRIRIKAIVEHAFYIKFPRDIMDVHLTPPGGWGSWVNGGVTPQRLSGEVPFFLSSSWGFKVSMLCEHDEGQGCGLRNKASGEKVPLDVRMTIPGFLSHGQPLRGLPLSTGDVRIVDPPSSLAADLRSKLNFSVSSGGVERMVRDPGSKWEGVVTLVFDSDIQ